jgi:hypothetical protein
MSGMPSPQTIRIRCQALLGPAGLWPPMDWWHRIGAPSRFGVSLGTGPAWHIR